MQAMNKRFRLTLLVACLCLSVAEQASAYYAAHMGRFMSRDPKGEIGRFGTGLPHDSGMATGFIDRGQFDSMGQYSDGMNLYQYVGGSPISNFDPSGLSEISNPDIGQPWPIGQPRPDDPPPDPCLDAGDWLDCMSCCLSGDTARRVVVGGVGMRKVKIESFTEVSTTSIWKKQLNWIGTKCGKALHVSRHLARQVVSKTVVVVTITEGFYDIAKTLDCTNKCAPIDQ
jgi:hypothetical protein